VDKTRKNFIDTIDKPLFVQGKILITTIIYLLGENKNKTVKYLLPQMEEGFLYELVSYNKISLLLYQVP
jgi:hypothetical protein